MIAGAHANDHVEEDRAAAIHRAVREAGPEDVVLIAGKGHETYQEIAGEAPALQRRRRSRAQRCSGGTEAMRDIDAAAREIGAGRRGPDASFDGVSTDSRQVSHGDLFVALKGERFDGHDFVDQALERAPSPPWCPSRSA